MVTSDIPRRGNLQSSLDRDVSRIIRTLHNEQGEGRSPLSVYSVYQSIQSSNSALKRRPKNLLEASIERVLSSLQQDDMETDGMASQAYNSEEPENTGAGRQPSDRNNIMNRALRASLAANNNPSASTAADTVQEDGKLVERETVRPMNGEPSRKRKRPQDKQSVARSPPSHVRLEDVGGVDDIKKQLADHLVIPLLRPEAYVERKIPIPRGILLHGPPGCGKTLISKAFATKLNVPFVEILGPSIVSSLSGESEQKIREHFDEARRLAPCLIFIDEIDVIAPKRESSQSQMEKRIVAQLLISMDGLAMESNDGKPVIVLAATNRPDSLDPALRRGGRFDTEINMGVPNESMRAQILRTMTREMTVAPDVDFAELANMTAGFVGADLRDLIGKAGTWSMDLYKLALEQQAAQSEDEDMQPDQNGIAQSPPNKASPADRSISRLIKRLMDKDKEEPTGVEFTALTRQAFLAVLPGIQPSSKREGFATIPDTKWTDIGASEDIKEELMMTLVRPIKEPTLFERYGITAASGVLLWGPPGCGKTLLAKAVANESRANLISVRGAELFNKFLGESERAVRQVFARARSSVPCVLFFDEIDALLPSRSSGAGSDASARVVNTMLSELDGMSSRDGIYLIAATNRPDIIDPAMLRPGRLDSSLYVGLPTAEERVSILRTLILAKKTVDVQLAEIARSDDCHNFSGADLTKLLGTAQRIAFKRCAEYVEAEDFATAARAVRPSVIDLERYEAMKPHMGFVNGMG